MVWQSWKGMAGRGTAWQVGAWQAGCGTEWTMCLLRGHQSERGEKTVK